MRIPAAALVALLVAGCASVREPRAPEPSVPPPPAWGNGAAAEYGVPDAWWGEFGDPTLSGFVEEALEANPALTEAEARLRAALALSEIAGADLLPKVAAGQEAGRANQFIGGQGIPGLPSTQRSDRFGVSLNSSWELDLWARIRSGEAAAAADAGAQEEILRGVRLSLSGQTAKAYLAATEARLQIDVAAANLKSAEDLSSRLRERFERGLRRAVDVKLADVEVASARASLIAFQLSRDSAVRQLEELAGRYPAGGAETAATLPPLPGPIRPGVPAGVLSRRPDLAAAERRLAATSYRIQEAEASLYPRISLTGSAGLASSALKDLVRGDFGVWSLAQGLAAPLFEGGRLRKNVELRQAQEDEAAAAFAGRALTAFREVETALAAERFLAMRAEALEVLVLEARAGLTLTEDRYLEGLVNILTVIDARRRLFTSKSQLLRVRLEHLTTRVDLYTALGGGTTPEEPTRTARW